MCHYCEEASPSIAHTLSVCCVLLFWWCHICKTQIIIVFVFFSFLGCFSNHVYLQNRHKCIEPFQEPWLIPASDLICKMFLKTDRKKQRCCRQMYGNIMNCTCVGYAEPFYIFSVHLSFYVFNLFLSLSLSLSESWEDCITACLTAWSTMWFCILTDCSVLFGFVLVIFQRWISQACMRHCCFSERGSSVPPLPPHAFSSFYCQTLLYFFFFLQHRRFRNIKASKNL